MKIVPCLLLLCTLSMTASVPVNVMLQPEVVNATAIHDANSTDTPLFNQTHSEGRQLLLSLRKSPAPAPKHAPAPKPAPAPNPAPAAENICQFGIRQIERAPRRVVGKRSVVCAGIQLQ